MEIERKYLIATLPPLAGVLSNNILQGYLAIDDTHEVRLRQIGPDYILTVKVGTGLVRQEHETVISKQQFSLLWPAVNDRSVSKVRYYLPDDISVDIYEGPLAGLTVAEIEFDTVRASDSYIPPHWFGPEVTSDLRFKNRSLASAGTIAEHPRGENGFGWDLISINDGYTITRAEMDQATNEETYATVMKPYAQVREFLQSVA